MDLWTIALYLEDVVPAMQVIEGRVFLDRKKVGKEGLIEQIREFRDLLEAQKWINMVPIDDFYGEVADDWNLDSPSLVTIKDIYERSWKNVASSLGVAQEALGVNLLTDTDTGDVILQLYQTD